ncbi:MAG: hypothetical protein RMY34_31010 [Aulosira sp. DedQUE10]|nr:hypothetical protein [Aulosira sp. DedQUE10]
MVKFTKSLLQVLGWLFFFAAFGSLILYFPNRIDSIIPSTTFAALFGVFLTEASRTADKQIQRSKFFLEQSLLGFDHAVNLLSDRNNDRLKYISVARRLQQSLELSEKITEKEHKIILQMEIDRYRHQLWEILNPDDEHITSAFFYGVSDRSLNIDEAAKQSSLPKIGGTKDRISSIHSLSCKSLFVIWNFMEFPKNYADPLHNTFSQEQIEALQLQHKPLYEYLQHKQKHHSIAGKLHKLLDKEQ